jgi:hypothetical protein
MAFSGIQVGFRHNPGFRPFWGMGVLGGSGSYSPKQINSQLDVARKLSSSTSSQSYSLSILSPIRGGAIIGVFMI